MRWQPALAAAMAVALAVGISLYRPSTVVGPPPPPQISPAVADLEKLDKNAEVYNNFDMLYDDEENSSQ